MEGWVNELEFYKELNCQIFVFTKHTAYVAKYTITYFQSLITTFVSAGETLYECNRIDYFTKEEYSPDPNDSTLAIPCEYFFLIFESS